jgi:hypothetical protein
LRIDSDAARGGQRELDLNANNRETRLLDFLDGDGKHRFFHGILSCPSGPMLVEFVHAHSAQSGRESWESSLPDSHSL